MKFSVVIVPGRGHVLVPGIREGGLVCEVLDASDEKVAFRMARARGYLVYAEFCVNGDKVYALSQRHAESLVDRKNQ